MSPQRAPWLFAVLLAVTLAGGPPRTAAAPVTLNLNNADIGTLIATVAEVTGRNFVVDPRVKGKVSVVSSTALETDELYQVFLSILDVHGFAAVPSGRVVKIVPDANAKQSSTPVASATAPGQGDEVVTRVIQVENVTAAQLVPILRPLVPQQGHLAAYAPTNSLILSDRAGNVKRLATIIARMDQESDSDLEVIPLENASAAEVVRVLTALEQGPRTAAQDPGAVPKLVADERTNSVLLSADRVDRVRLRGIIAHLDTPLQTTGDTHVIYLRYAKAEELAAVLTDISADMEEDPARAAGQAQRGQPARQVGIRADAASNALVITAPPDVFAALRSVISQLDIRRAQVLVEAIIAEVRSENAAELGVQWRDLVGGEDGSFVISNPQGSDFAGPEAASGLAGLSVGLVRNGDIRALLRALSSTSNTNLIATPTLVTLDNEEAEIVVGQNVPFVTGQFTNDATTPDNPFQTIERQDVGLELKVTPQINEGNALSLVIAQEVSSVDTDTRGVDLITNKRSINTTVLVEDGQIVVLGGLIRDDFQTTEQKVPLLGDLPVLGALFRNTRTDTTKNNLMIFLKPSIIRTPADISSLTGRKYEYIRAEQLSQRARQPLAGTGTRKSVLPALEDVRDADEAIAPAPLDAPVIDLRDGG